MSFKFVGVRDYGTDDQSFVLVDDNFETPFASKYSTNTFLSAADVVDTFIETYKERSEIEIATLLAYYLRYGNQQMYQCIIDDISEYHADMNIDRYLLLL